jgi:glutamine amidotransferase PdxT
MMGLMNIKLVRSAFGNDTNSTTKMSSSGKKQVQRSAFVNLWLLFNHKKGKFKD